MTAAGQRPRPHLRGARRASGRDASCRSRTRALVPGMHPSDGGAHLRRGERRPVRWVRRRVARRRRASGDRRSRRGAPVGGGARETPGTARHCPRCLGPQQLTARPLGRATIDACPILRGPVAGPRRTRPAARRPPPAPDRGSPGRRLRRNRIRPARHPGRPLRADHALLSWHRVGPKRGGATGSSRFPPRCAAGPTARGPTCATSSGRAGHPLTSASSRTAAAGLPGSPRSTASARSAPWRARRPPTPARAGLTGGPLAARPRVPHP